MKDFPTDPRRIWNGRLIHFRARLAERVSPEINAGHLWGHIINIMTRRSGPEGDARYIGRTHSGNRVWLVVWQGHRVFFVFDHDMGCPCTVLPLDGYAVCNRRKIWLEAVQ